MALRHLYPSLSLLIPRATAKTPLLSRYTHRLMALRSVSTASLRNSFRWLPPASLNGISRRSVVTEIASTEMFKEKTATDKLVIVQYSASWCGPCRQMKPLVLKMSNEATDVEFLFVDIDDHAGLAEEAGIENVPTFILMKNGKELDKVIGANATKLREVMEKNK